MKIKVSLGDIESAIKAVDEFENSLKRKTKMFLERLAEIGIENAKISFKAARYDGDNDVVVNNAVWINDNKLAFSATGSSLLFIEFGAGVHFSSQSHPQAAEMGFYRGGYGHGLGRLDSWRYEGNPGSHGEVITTGKHKGEIKTHGNPANRCMYEAGKEIRKHIAEIAKEVFSGD